MRLTDMALYVHSGADKHLWAKGMGGGGCLDVRINLIALCLNDHGRVHLGKIARPDLLGIVAKR